MLPGQVLSFCLSTYFIKLKSILDNNLNFFNGMGQNPMDWDLFLNDNLMVIKDRFLFNKIKWTVIEFEKTAER